MPEDPNVTLDSETNRAIRSWEHSRLQLTAFDTDPLTLSSDMIGFCTIPMNEFRY